MAFLVDSAPRKLVDFFYNRAELVSRAFFDASMVLISHLPPNGVKVTFRWQSYGGNDEQSL